MCVRPHKNSTNTTTSFHILKNSRLTKMILFCLMLLDKQTAADVIYHLGQANTNEFIHIQHNADTKLQNCMHDSVEFLPLHNSLKKHT